jgi:hypothetical protein
MQQDSFTAMQSLELIRSMIEKTKDNISGNRFYFLLWGWITFFAVLGQFVLKVIVKYEHHYIVWLLIFVGIALSIGYSIREEKKRKVKTYVEENMSFLWTGMGISFLVLSILFIKIGWQYCFPFFILMYGLGTFVSGRILKFAPLVIGGIIAWVLAAIAVWVPFDYQMIFAAMALLFSYIIPGHLIK